MLNYQGGWKYYKKLISGGRHKRRGVEIKCVEIEDNGDMKHSVFINQASMVVRMYAAQNLTNRQEDLLKTSAWRMFREIFGQKLISGSPNKSGEVGKISENWGGENGQQAPTSNGMELILQRFRVLFLHSKILIYFLKFLI